MIWEKEKVRDLKSMGIAETGETRELSILMINQLINISISRLSCGIIARASGLFQNTKKICACDGVTLWDERDRSVTGWKNANSNGATSNTVCVIL